MKLTDEEIARLQKAFKQESGEHQLDNESAFKEVEHLRTVIADLLGCVGKREVTAAEAAIRTEPNRAFPRPIDMSKPHKGKLSDWFKVPCDDGIGFRISGLLEAPGCGLQMGHTSFVLAHDEATGEIETYNSRYTLVGGEATNADIEPDITLLSSDRKHSQT